MTEYRKHFVDGEFTHFSTNGQSFTEAPGNSDYDRMMQEVTDGTSTIVEQDDTPIPTVDELRRAGYGSVQDQLDMIYWDQVNGTSKWKDHVAQVKAANPKGQ